MTKKNQQDNLVLNKLPALPASIANSREFYNLVRQLKKPNPNGNDWKTIMETHQTSGSFTVAITAAGLNTTKLENILNNLFSKSEQKTLAKIIVSQLLMLYKMTQWYNIVQLSGIIHRIPDAYK